jgi:hypothetical protein
MKEELLKILNPIGQESERYAYEILALFTKTIEGIDDRIANEVYLYTPDWLTNEEEKEYKRRIAQDIINIIKKEINK